MYNSIMKNDFWKKLRIINLLLISSLMLGACVSSNSQSDSDQAMGEPKPCPTFLATENNLIPQVQADMLIEMTEADAEACAMQLGWLWRVGERDGELYAVTMDYRQNRVTVHIQDGFVYLVNVG
jgi:hypothetical protein